MERTQTALVPLCISQCKVVSWRYLLHNYLKDIQVVHRATTREYTFNTSATTVCINFWCNEIKPFRFSDSRIKALLVKRTLTKMTTRCHSLPVVITCSHSLSLVAPLVAIICHYLYHLLSFFVTRYITSLCFYQRS